MELVGATAHTPSPGFARLNTRPMATVSVSKMLTSRIFGIKILVRETMHSR
jgi:hypothetical protein